MTREEAIEDILDEIGDALVISTTGNGFKKGHKPWNKGIKGIHLSPKTEFTSEGVKEFWADKKNRKKIIDSQSNTNHWRWKDEGGEFKHSQGRYFIKHLGKWILRARYIYQKINNLLLDEKNIIHHIDGDITNDNIDNLELHNRKSHAKLHAKLNKIL